MTTAPADPEDQPFHSRSQAEAAFRRVRRAAGRARPGEQPAFLAWYLGDSIGFWTELGDYDRALIARLAGLLDPVDIAVVASWFYRVLGDVPDQSVNVVAPGRRHRGHRHPAAEVRGRPGVTGARNSGARDVLFPVPVLRGGVTAEPARSCRSTGE